MLSLDVAHIESDRHSPGAKQWKSKVFSGDAKQKHHESPCPALAFDYHFLAYSQLARLLNTSHNKNSNMRVDRRPQALSL